jgi:hypothetical protein
MVPLFLKRSKIPSRLCIIPIYNTSLGAFKNPPEMDGFLILALNDSNSAARRKERSD